jgi:predicted MFS family arabinose efflux permease
MNNQNGQDGFLVSKGHAYYVFVLLFLLFMFDWIDRQVIASLFPYLKQDWGLTDTQCGLLISVVYWCFVILVLPVSVLMDRWNRKTPIALMAATWSLATVGCALTRNFGQLFTARAIIGVGEAAYTPGGLSMISGLFPQRIRATMVGIWNAAPPLGIVLGVLAGGYIATHYGWRHAFGIVGLPGFIIGLLFFFVRDYRAVDLAVTVHNERGSEAKRKMSKGDVFRQLVGTPSLMLTYFAYAGNMFLSVSLVNWLPTYFHRVENLPVDKASARASVLFLLAIVSSALGGFLADRWQKKRANARMLLPALASAFVAVCTFSAFTFFREGPRYFVLLLSSLTGTFFPACGHAVTQDVVHPGLRATSSSGNLLVQHFLGSALGPLIVGMLSDKYNIGTALAVVSLVPLISAVLWFIGSRFYEKDLAKIEKVALVIQ